MVLVTIHSPNYRHAISFFLNVGFHFIILVQYVAMATVGIFYCSKDIVYTTKTLLFSAHMVFEYLLPQMFAT